MRHNGQFDFFEVAFSTAFSFDALINSKGVRDTETAAAWWICMGNEEESMGDNTALRLCYCQHRKDYHIPAHTLRGCEKV
jgi:hypothetical protein